MEDAGLEGGSVASYWKALCHMEICLSKTCTIPMIQEGFKISGIYPIDNEAILSGWSGWSLCNKVKTDELISLLPTLTEIVKIRGRVTDDEIESCMGHLIDFDEGTKKLDNCPMNHGRCVWTNNGKIIETYEAKKKADMEKNIEKDNRAMLKEWRLQQPERAASEDKRVKARNSAAVTASPSTLPTKKARQLRCGNSGCRASGLAVDRGQWIKCKTKKCALIFCANCRNIAEEHERICRKGIRADEVG
jgi:hypothetical protein